MAATKTGGKSFRQAPKPPPLSAEQIAAYERAGPGHDTRARPAADTPAEPTKRLSIDMPESLHTRFMILCARQKTKMAPQTIDLIRGWIDGIEPAG